MARPRAYPAIEMGLIIGQLTVISEEEWRDKSNRLRRRFGVRCECGKEEFRTEAGLIKRIYVRCHDCILKRNTRDLHHRGVSRVYDSYKESARVRNLEFAILRDRLESLITDNCFYCSSEPSSKRLVQTKSGDEYFLYNGIDRIDSSLGYIEGNVVTCCQDCNYGKRTMSQEDFIAWARRVVEVADSRALTRQ